MTSNQIAYWKNQEEIRANRAREAENQRANMAKEAETVRSNLAKEAETARHNLTQEQIDKVSNELTARGLDIKDTQQVMDLAEFYAKYGYMDTQQMPPDIMNKLGDLLGVDPNSQDFNQGISSWWSEVKDIFSGFGKFVRALF